MKKMMFILCAVLTLLGTSNAFGSTCDLSGKLVGEASKGIYIKNGKKVVK